MKTVKFFSNKKNDHRYQYLAESFPSDEKLIYSINENQIEDVSKNIAKNILATIKSKKDILDSKEIDASKGVIKKFISYEHIIESMKYIEVIYKDNINIMNQMEYDTIMERLDIIRGAIANLVKFEKQFTTGYATDKETVVLLYRTIVMAVMISVNFILAYSMDYERTVDNTFIVVFKKRHYYNQASVGTTISLIDQLKIFNKISDNGKLSSFFQYSLKESGDLMLDGKGGIKSLNEEIVLFQFGIYFIVSVIVLIMIKRIAFSFVNLRQNLSNYFNGLAQFTEMAISANKARAMDPSKRAKIIKRQETQVAFMKKLGKFLEVNDEIAYKKTEDSVRKDVKDAASVGVEEKEVTGNSVNMIDTPRSKFQSNDLI